MKDFKMFLRLGVVFIIIILLLKDCLNRSNVSNLKLQLNNYKVLQDSLKSYKDKNGILSSKVETLQGTSYKQLLELKSNKVTLTMVQNELQQYKSKTQNSTGFSSQTKFDTIIKTEIIYVHDTLYQDGDTVLVPKTIHSVKHKDAWVDIDIQSDSANSYIGVKIENEYTVTLNKNKKKWEAIVKNRNPYSNIKEITAINLNNPPKPKLFGIGIHLGYGINSSLQLNPYIGIGVSYNIIRL